MTFFTQGNPWPLTGIPIIFLHRILSLCRVTWSPGFSDDEATAKIQHLSICPHAVIKLLQQHKIYGWLNTSSEQRSPFGGFFTYIQLVVVRPVLGKQVCQRDQALIECVLILNQAGWALSWITVHTVFLPCFTCLKPSCTDRSVIKTKTYESTCKWSCSRCA